MKTFNHLRVVAASYGILLLYVASLAIERVQAAPLTASASATASAVAGVPRRNHVPTAQTLLSQLLQLESKPAESLQDCAQWFDLNVKYIQAKGEHKMRQSEWAKKQECDKLDKAAKQINQKLTHFKHMMHAENDQLDFVAGLVSEFLKFKKSAAEDAQFGTAIQSLIESDPIVKGVLDKLERFAQFMAQVLEAESSQAAAEPQPDLDGDGEADDAPEPVPESGDIDQGDLRALENAIKALVDAEDKLTDDQLNELIELTDMLEKVLADGQTVDVTSGKFRYLSGTLDAARAVILHKSIPSPANESEGLSAATAAHAQAATVALNDLASHNFAHSQATAAQKLDAAASKLDKIPSYASPTATAHAAASAMASVVTQPQPQPQVVPQSPQPKPKQQQRRKMAADLRAAAMAQASSALQQHLPENAKQRFGDQIAQSFAAGQFNGF